MLPPSQHESYREFTMRDGYLLNASGHCNATDSYPRRCDFLVHNGERSTGSTVLIAFFITGLVAAEACTDLDQAAAEWHLWRHLLEQVAVSIPLPVVVLVWVNHALRVIALPFLAFFALGDG